MDDMSPIKVIESGKWKSALFTTYALSLSFFESVVLRKLHEADCREIWVVADAEGYRSSLMERRSSQVGQGYRLVPVALPHGVFHPKCTYLHGIDDDILMIGSGNLTFGGYGRNVEVLEVLQSGRDPELFHDFADFLNALGSRRDFLMTETGWIKQFSQLSQEAGLGANLTGRKTSPRLLHSVVRPVLDQFADVIAEHEPPSRITVLSPFHDQDGGIIRKLVDRTGCTALAIGLPTASTEASSFPFSAKSEWPCDVKAVLPDISDPNRPLHAKWISAKVPETDFVMTGSVNATRKSFGTTDNIEIAVLRSEVGTNAQIAWEPAPIPSVCAEQSVRPAGLGDSCILYAKLNSTGYIEGRILSVKPMEDYWIGELQRPAGDTFEFDVTVRGDGWFTSTEPAKEEFWFSTSVQVELIGDTCTARGWLHQEEVLRSQHLGRLNLGSLLRLINREETEDDDVALLDYLAVSLTEHVNVFRPRAQFAGGRQSTGHYDQDQNRSIPLEFLQPSDDTVDGASNGGPLAGSKDPLHRLFFHLRKRFLGQRQAHENPAADHDSSHPKVWNNSDYEARDSDGLEKIGASLEYFTSELRDLLDEAPPELMRGLLVVWLEVSLHMLLRRIKSFEQAHQFASAWFLKSTMIAVAADEWGALEDHVVTIGTVIAGTTDFGSIQADKVHAQIHEGFERFFRRNLFITNARKALNSGTGSGFAELFNLDLDKQLQSLELIIKTPTLRQLLLRILDDFFHHRPLPKDSPLFQGVTGKAFRRALNRKNGAKYLVLLQNGTLGCPHCCRDLSAEAAALHRNRIVVCDGCNRLVIRLTP